MKACAPVNGRNLHCSSCSNLNCTEPIEKVSDEAFKKAAKSTTIHATAICKKCKITFGSDQLLRQGAKSLGQNIPPNYRQDFPIPLHEDPAECDKATSDAMSLPIIVPFPKHNSSEEYEDGFNLEKALYDLTSVQLILYFQVHAWQHVKSCFKKSGNSSPGHCRYSMQRIVVDFTYVESEESIANVVMKRTLRK